LFQKRTGGAGRTKGKNKITLCIEKPRKTRKGFNLGNWRESDLDAEGARGVRDNGGARKSKEGGGWGKRK